MKNAMRLSALMNQNVTYILTHDSIGVGEDGPTHQPVEQLAGLRAIPNMKVFRPADGKETAYAWISALTGKGPVCLVLTRQNLPQYEHSNINALRGAYILEDSEKETPDAVTQKKRLKKKAWTSASFRFPAPNSSTLSRKNIRKKFSPTPYARESPSKRARPIPGINTSVLTERLSV